MSPRRLKHALLATKRTTNVKLVEPPSCSSASTIVFIGRNSRGDWVAQEQSGLYGGLFVNRAQAVKYAIRERPSPRNHRRATARNRARHERQASPPRPRHTARRLSLIHISEPTRQAEISYAVF